MSERRRRFGPFELDPRRRTLTGADGVPIEVQPKVLDLLAVLSGAPDRIFTKAELLEAVWPGVRVTDASLHQALRKARRALGDDPDAPAYVEAVSRHGWRWIAPIETVDPDPRPAGRSSGELVGRAVELAEIADRVVPGGALLLHGPGGIGKTRLARVALADTDAVVVALGTAKTASDVVRAVADALGIAVEGADGAAAIGRAVEGRTILLDEVEAAAEVVGQLLAAWRRSAPTAAWLLTSRVLVPGTEVLAIPPLTEAESTELLHRCLPADVVLDDPAALVGLLDGLPLAIELAASRLRLVPAARLADRLRAGANVLSSSTGRGLWVSLQASWELLSSEDRLVLAACAVFPGPFDAESVESLLPDGDSVLDGLERLIAASLVHQGDGRLVVTGLVRAYVHAEAERTGIAGDLVARWVAGLVARTRVLVPRALRWDADALAMLRTLRDEGVAAFRVAADDDVAIALALGCRYGGPWDLAADALAALPSPSPLARALRGEYAARLGRVDAAEADLRATADDGDPVIAGICAFLLARIAAARGDADEAIASADRAERLATAAGNDPLAALALDVAGTVHRSAGRRDQVRACYDRALGRVDGAAGRLARVIVAQNYAASLAWLGEREEALARLKIAADAAATLPMPHLAAVARANLATASLSAGRVGDAVPLLEGSLAEARRVGDRASASKHASELALACAILGDGARAEALLDAVAGTGPRHSLRRAWAAVARGDVELGWSRVASASALATDDDDRAEVAVLAIGLARTLGDEVRGARFADEAAGLIVGRPELAAVAEAWARGGPVPPEMPEALIPDAWFLA